MDCTKCGRNAVYHGQGQSFCRAHFMEYFENKVYRTINRHGLIVEGDIVCVAASGGKDSINALYLTSLYCAKNNIRFFALAIDEGIKGYRDKTLADLKKFCQEHEIELHIASFVEDFGYSLDDLKQKGLDKNRKPCTVCGIFRRTLLNRKSRELHATKLVTGHNLDDEAQSFIMNITLGNMSHNASLGPISGLSNNKKFVARVKPLYFVTEKESRLYALLKGFMIDFTECPNIDMSYRALIRDELNNIEQKLPGAKNGIVNSFLEIMPLLKEKYRGVKEKKTFTYCSSCGDACSGKICNACILEEELCQ